jgi:para-aminobenzoate synthetase component I
MLMICSRAAEITYFCAMQVKSKFQITDSALFKKKLIHWCAKHPCFAILDRNSYNFDRSYHLSFEMIAAVGEEKIISDSGHAFEELKNFRKNDWAFGIFGYDLKNEIEKLSSANFDGVGFHDIQFFKPDFLFFINNNELEVHAKDTVSQQTILSVFGEIENTDIMMPDSEPLQVLQRMSKEEYLQKVIILKEHIHRGDIFEVNFCQEFYAPYANVDPSGLFLRLSANSPAPFSCFFRFEDKYLISASPERFLKKTDRKIISQPMKGTIKRSMDDNEDRQLKETLRNDPKEISENIMITDLVRNDLSRTAVPESVKVEELCGVYSYKNVHQMVTTIVSELHSSFDEYDVIKSCFPMGSMTGAPKVRAMQLIEEHEKTKRGIFSGAAGYFTPAGDFDFNVVIRSILYNSSSRYLSFSTGGAITSLSVPENEYEECLLKAKALRMSCLSFD